MAARQHGRAGGGREKSGGGDPRRNLLPRQGNGIMGVHKAEDKGKALSENESLSKGMLNVANGIHFLQIVLRRFRLDSYPAFS